MPGTRSTPADSPLLAEWIERSSSISTVYSTTLGGALLRSTRLFALLQVRPEGSVLTKTTTHGIRPPEWLGGRRQNPFKRRADVVTSHDDKSGRKRCQPPNLGNPRSGDCPSSPDLVAGTFFGVEEERPRRSVTHKPHVDPFWRRALGAGLERRLVRPPVDPPGEAAAPRDFPRQMIEPGEPVGGYRHGRHRRAADRRDLRQSPSVASLPCFKEKVEVPPRGVVGGTYVFEEDEARHGKSVSRCEGPVEPLGGRR